jgi:hypothetical protein
MKIFKTSVVYQSLSNSSVLIVLDFSFLCNTCHSTQTIHALCKSGKTTSFILSSFSRQSRVKAEINDVHKKQVIIVIIMIAAAAHVFSLNDNNIFYDHVSKSTNKLFALSCDVYDS